MLSAATEDAENIEDAVILCLLPPLDSSDAVEISLWVVPASLRKPLVYGFFGDDGILEATEVILSLRAMVHRSFKRSFQRIKRMERSSCSCYMALPATLPYYRMNPCEIYMVLATSFVMDLFGRTFSLAEVLSLVWGFPVPTRCPRCPRCDASKQWCFLDGDEVSCWSCDYQAPLRPRAGVA